MATQLINIQAIIEYNKQRIMITKQLTSFVHYKIINN
jgi:hypothetical protein